MANPNDFQKPKLPTPKIPDQYQRLTAPHFSTPSGMLLPQAQQPPPMFGLRGSTIPPKFMTKPPPTFKELVVNHPYKKPLQQEDVEPTLFCDFCDRSFRGEEKLDKHKLQLHKELMGIKPRVYTDEEINEWKEARKKRYPTTQNVLARQQAQAERINRGERLEESKSRFGRKQDRRQPTNTMSFQRRENKSEIWQNKKVSPNNRKKYVPPILESKKSSIETTEVTGVETLNGLSKFQGTSGLPNYERTRVLKQTNALSCLGTYGSGTESESDEESQCQNEVSVVEKTFSDNELPLETPIVKVDPFTDAEIASTPNRKPPPKDLEPEGGSSKKRHRKRKHSKGEISEASGDAAKEQKTVETPSEKRKHHEMTASTSNHPRALQTPWFRRYRRYQNTMLEKLLQPEMRHERNVLLQSVRFVVQNKFFGIGSENREDLTDPNNTPDTDKNE